MTTTEAADRLDLGRRSTYERLERLVEHGRLETKSVGANGRVWWRPLPTGERSPGGREWPAAGASLIDDALEEAEIGVFILDENFDVAWINDATVRYFGLDRDRVLGRDKRTLVEERIAPAVDDSAGFAETILATYEDNSAVERFECRVAPGDGREERWLEHRSRPIESGPYAGGRIELYYDLTDQCRRATQLQRLNEAVNEWLEESTREAVAELASRHLHRIPEMSVNGVFLHEPAADELRPVAWTDRAEALFGDVPTFAAGEGIAWRVFETGDPEVYADVSEAPGVYDPATTARSEMVLPIGDHGVAIVGSEERDAFDEDDATLARIVASALEVTFDRIEQRRRLEARTSELETELGQIYGRISHGVYALDDQWRFTHVNERAAALLGRSREELLGEVFWDVHPEAEGSELSDRYREAMATQEPTTFERYSETLGVWTQVNVYPSETGLSVYFRDVSERKHRERQLEQYRALTEAASDVIVTIDEESTIRTVNPAVEHVFGYEPGEVIGESLAVFMPDDLVESHEAALARYLDTGERSIDWEYVELPGVRADGTEISLAISFSEVEYDDTRYFSGVVRDITDRKTRERELERALDLLHRTERTADVGGWEIDPDTMEVFWTDYLFDLLGVDTEDEPTVEEALDVYHEEDRPIIEGAVRDALEHGDPFDVEARFRTPDGAVRWLRVQGEPEIVDGEVVSLRGAAQDVTDRKEKERQLERYKEYTDDILDTIDDMFYVVDEAGNYERWNESMSEVTGYTDAEIASMHPLEFIAEEDRAAIGNGIAEIFETGAARVEAEVLTKDGETAPFEFVASTLEDPDGRTVLAGIGRDIAERKEYERKLEESNERLEQFAYAASHDLQEPLRMVSSYLRLLEDRYVDDLDADAEEFIEFAVDGAERMRAMIDGLLAYSRVETRGDPFEAVDLETVFADTLRDLQVKIEESGAEIDAESLPRVQGDAGQLRQVLQNLLDNAIEYSGDGPPRIEVSADRDGERWIVSVRDHGIGIDPDDADRIFEVFQRLHTHDEHSGTGIGLALCQRIVERHDGDLWVESEPGSGSTFRFALPAARGGADDPRT